MDLRIINNIKSLGLDMINSASSGHPGIVLGAAPIIYTVFKNHLHFNVDDYNWINRDRFVMSAGHGSALLYATMFMAGYDLTKEDLKNFRQINSKTPGHPEYGITNGVETTTGPLGQGIASAVGMAMAQKLLHNENSNIDYKVYVLCSDGDLMEGVTNEALSLAGSLNLNNLIILYDSNDICLDGKVNETFKENIQEKYKALGFHVDFIIDGNNIDDISESINRAKKSNMPSLIEIKTIIGDGSKYENTNIVHGKPLEKEDLNNLKEDLNFYEAFEVDLEARNFFKQELKNRSLKKYNDFMDLYIKDNFEVDFDKIEIDNKNDEMRNMNGKIMSAIANYDNMFLSGSADLFSSTKTKLENKQLFNLEHQGNNIAFGVREHAMGSIANGLALSSFRPTVSTFLAFLDYLKPSLRLSALMNLNVTYVFTHDSITIGSDGPTHQPIEQLAMLRATPNIITFRPADYNELIGTWDYMYSNDGANAVVVTKEKVNLISTSSKHLVKKGGYVIAPEKEFIHGIIIATGYEVHTALKLKEELYEREKLDLRIVSMPSVELFLKQSEEYQNQILPKTIRKIVIEAASSFGWHQFVYNRNYLITIDNFGHSGSKNDVLKACNFDYESIYERVKKVLK